MEGMSPESIPTAVVGPGQRLGSETDGALGGWLEGTAGATGTTGAGGEMEATGTGGTVVVARFLLVVVLGVVVGLEITIPSNSMVNAETRLAENNNNK
jgi:hypothetical protein